MSMRLSKPRVLCILAIATFLTFVATNSSAQPSLEDVKAAIEKGVKWLAQQQNPDDGSWGSDGDPKCAITALVVKKLEHHAVDPKWGLGYDSPFDEAYEYRENVEKGLEYLFDNCAATMDIDTQLAGEPDSDGDGIGVVWDNGYHTYTSGIALMTLCEAVELDRVVESGPLAGWTYEDVARDTMDYLVFGQNDAGWERGGWGYTDNYVGWSDNSNSGWATLGLGFAETPAPGGCGFEIPGWVKEELNIWIDYIQNDVDGDPNDGGSGYDAPGSWVNILKTGNLLQQMALVGDTADSDRVQAALDYMCRHWDDANQDPGWKGNGGSSSYQATFTAMKGFTSLGIHEIPCEPAIDWQADFEEELVAEQIPANPEPDQGYWEGCFWGNPILCTVWALLTLQKAAPPPPVVEVPVDIKPTSCPNPLNVKSRGVLPLAVLGTEDFDVTQIDPTTVCLFHEDPEVCVSPLRWAYEDVATPFETNDDNLDGPDCYDCTEEGADGYLDLTLKFDMQEVVTTLTLTEEADRACIVLYLKGNLLEDYNGTPLIGQDVVRILNRAMR